MGDYASIAEVRATDGLDDATTFPDATITEAITWAEELIDRYTGTSWVSKSFDVTLSGNDSASIQLKDDEGRTILYPLTLTSVTVDGTAATGLSGWALYPNGVIVRDSGVFTSSSVGRNIVVQGTAGADTTAPADISWAARTLARQYALDLVSRVPDRALQVQNEFGTVQLSQASSHPDRPTSLPEVNSRLAHRRQITDSNPF